MCFLGPKLAASEAWRRVTIKFFESISDFIGEPKNFFDSCQGCQVFKRPTAGKTQQLNYLHFQAIVLRTQIPCGYIISS
jgi:hypothetical protein